MQKADTPLNQTFAFWLIALADSQRDIQQPNYQDLLKKIGSFSTVSEFWSYFQYMVKAEKLPEASQLLLFKDQIQPEWEDKQNQNGGRFIFRVRRGWGNRVWEELVLKYVGDTSEEAKSICGLIVHAKKNFILISIWVKETTEEEYLSTQAWIVKTIGLNKQNLEYLPHPRDGEQQYHK